MPGFDKSDEEIIEEIVEKIAQSEIFAKVDKERIRGLVHQWFDTGHWWEPDELDLVLFLEGDI